MNSSADTDEETGVKTKMGKVELVAVSNNKLDEMR